MIENLDKITDTLRCLLTDAVQRTSCDCLSLSGGLDSSILASCLAKKIPALTLVTQNFESPDLIPSQLVARHIGLKLDVIHAKIEQVLDAIEDTIKILQVFNPIEIRNNVVVYLTMKYALSLGYKSIMTGDGADELFAGYNFFKRLSGNELEHDLKRIWHVMHYPSKTIADSLGMIVRTPFLDDSVSAFAKNIPVDIKIKDENGIKYGKWILRKSFENDLPKSIVWREKTAMQDGSGTNGLGSFFDNLIPDFVFADKSQHYKKESVLLSSKESLYYYEIYRKYFDIPSKLKSSERQCPQCNFALAKDSHFCRMCGSYPV